ncbi:hypothetical protein ACG7TL_005561 [Trametes sanguinea]
MLRAEIPLLVVPTPTFTHLTPPGSSQAIYTLCTAVPNLLTMGRFVKLYALNKDDAEYAGTNRRTTTTTTLLGIEGDLVGIREIGRDVVELVVRNGNPSHPIRRAFIRCYRTPELCAQLNIADELSTRLAKLLVDQNGHTTIYDKNSRASPPPTVASTDQCGILPNEDDELSEPGGSTPVRRSTEDPCTGMQNRTGVAVEPVNYYPPSAMGPPTTPPWQYYRPPNDTVYGQKQPRDSRFHAQMWNVSPPSLPRPSSDWNDGGR